MIREMVLPVILLTLVVSVSSLGWTLEKKEERQPCEIAIEEIAEVVNERLEQ
jgi:hypothetical protein